MIDTSATMKTEDDSEILDVWDFGPQKRTAQVYKPSLYEDAEEQMAMKNWADVYRPRRPRSEIKKLRPVPSFQALSIPNCFVDLPQPETQPSPTLRKSMISEEVERAMAPLGLARTFPISRVHPKLEEVTGEKWVHGGNPFAKMLAARKPLENPNDLSQLRDIPKKNKVKKQTEVGGEDEEEEEEEEEAEGDFILNSTTPDLVTIFAYKPHAGPLNTRKQPTWFRIEERILMASPNIFRQAFAPKKKADRQDLARAVYNPDTATVFNPHIPHTAIYLQSLLVSRFAQNSEGYHCLEGLNIAQIWTGVLFWGYFQAHDRTFPAKSTEEIIACAMLVGLFLGDDAYYGTLLRMVVDRRYAEVWPRVHDLVSASLPGPV